MVRRDFANRTGVNTPYNKVMAPTTCTVPEKAITQCQLLVASYTAPEIGGPSNSPAAVQRTSVDFVRQLVHLERQKETKVQTTQQGSQCHRTKPLLR